MMKDAEERVRRILNVPDTHSILYMHGGAHGFFSGVPLNLCSADSEGVYVVTGYWSQRASDEGERHLKNVTRFSGVKDRKMDHSWEKKIPKKACFVHICASETIDGYEFFEEPNTGDVPLVGDFTSTLLSREVDISKYAAIYASGGKNLGPAGFALLIVRNSLLERKKERKVPSILDWSLFAKSTPIKSIYNTPPTWNIYMHGIVMELLENKGGMKSITQRVKDRAAKIYSLTGTYYVNEVDSSCRSAMSIPMTIGKGANRRTDLEKKFVKEAEEHGMIQLFGHPVKGGLRVTLYLGIPDVAVDLLYNFMDDFQKDNPLKEED